MCFSTFAPSSDMERETKMDTRKSRLGPGAPKTAKELLDLYYLHARSCLIEAAATLDRLDRADGREAISDDSRIINLKRMCEVILENKGNRVEKILLLLSESI